MPLPAARQLRAALMSTALGVSLLPAFIATPAADAATANAATARPSAARIHPIAVRLKAPHRASSTQASRLRVVLGTGHRGRIRSGNVVIRTSERVLTRHHVATGQRRITVRLPKLRDGVYRLVAVYRVAGHRFGTSQPHLLELRTTTGTSASPSASFPPSVAAPASARDCIAAPSACGYPDATTTGVTPGTTLKTYNSTVTVSTNGAVFENAIVNGALNITANNVTIRNVRVINNGDGWGIGLMHTNGTTIDHVQVMRGNGQRLESGIKDVYGDDTNTTITNADVSGTETGIFMHEGLLRDSYIHDLAMNTGDHVNGVSSNGETTPLSIDHNTILNPISQTDAIALFQDFGLEANRTITNNLIAGGGYSLYAGAGSHGTSHHIVITGNRFSRLYYPKGGSYGPATAYDTNGTGNAWTNNTWDDTGTTVTP